MYPKVDYHFLLIADIDERVRRKIGQYEGKITEQELKKHIEERDKLQQESGYYKIHPITRVIDVTNFKTPEDTMNKLLEYINI